MKLFITAQIARLKAYLKSPKFRTQVKRALRLFAFTFGVAIVGMFKSHALTAKAAGAAVVAAAEVTFRAFWPADIPAPAPAPKPVEEPPAEPTEPSDASAD